MKVEDLLNKIEKLPPAPALLPRLLSLLGDVNSNPDEVIGLIRVDPSMTAQVLRLGNSVYYGATSPSYDLQDAVNRIGFREVYKLVALVCGQDLFNRSIAALMMDKGELWEYSLGTAFVLEQMATAFGADAVTAYTVGLLHSIGKIVITSNEDMDYDEVFTLVEQKQLSLPEAEREVWGITHCELGAALLRKWGFKEVIAAPIQFQDRPAQAGVHRQMASMLHLSIFTVASLGLNFGRDAWALKADPFAMHFIGLKEDQMQRFLVSAYDKLAEIKTLIAQAETA